MKRAKLSGLQRNAQALAASGKAADFTIAGSK
jgi:hypothetical protein